MGCSYDLLNQAKSQYKNMKGVVFLPYYDQYAPFSSLKAINLHDTGCTKFDLIHTDADDAVILEFLGSGSVYHMNYVELARRTNTQKTLCKALISSQGTHITGKHSSLKTNSYRRGIEVFIENVLGQSKVDANSCTNGRDELLNKVVESVPNSALFLWSEIIGAPATRYTFTKYVHSDLTNAQMSKNSYFVARSLMELQSSIISVENKWLQIS